MRKRRRIFKYTGVVALFSAVGLIASASPAAADTVVGAGAGYGWEYPTNRTGPPRFQMCDGNVFSDLLESTRIELQHPASTFDGVDDQGTASPLDDDVVSWLGTTDITVNLKRHYVSPIGTHPEETAPAGCFVPQPVPIDSVSVNGDPLIDGGNVTCGAEKNGTFTRAQSAVVIDFELNCTIVGNVEPGTLNERIHFRWEGTMVPCTLAPTEELNPVCIAAAQATPPEPPIPPGEALTSDQYPGSYLNGAFEALTPDLL